MSEPTLKHCKITKIECENENTFIGWDYINLGAKIKAGTDTISGLVWPFGNLAENWRGIGPQKYNPIVGWVREWRGQKWKAVTPNKNDLIVVKFDEDAKDANPKGIGDDKVYHIAEPNFIIKEGFQSLTFILYDNESDGSDQNELGRFTVDVAEKIGNPVRKKIESDEGGKYWITYKLEPPETPHLSGEPAKIDAAFLHPNGNFYLFYENAYARFPADGTTMAPGYPLPIEGHWKNVPGTFSEGIDAALNAKGIKGGNWWFRGNQLIDFGGNTTTMPAGGGPTAIEDDWDIGDFANGIDAAVEHGNGYTYLFKGGKYIRLNKNTKSMAKGKDYPASLSKWELTGEFLNGIDAAFRHPNGNTYFFAGDEYVRYVKNSIKVDSGYPKPIKGHWDFVANISNPAQQDELPSKIRTLQFIEYLWITLPRVFEQLAGMTPVHGIFEGKSRKDSWNFRLPTITESEEDGHGRVTVYNPQWLVSSVFLGADTNSDIVKFKLSVGVLDKIKTKEETEDVGSTEEYTTIVMYYKIDWEKNSITHIETEGFPTTLSYNQDSNNKPIFKLIDIVQTIPGIGDTYGVFKSVVIAADKLGAFDKKDKGRMYLSTITNLVMLLQDGAIKTIFRAASTSKLHSSLIKKASFEASLSKRINKAVEDLSLSDGISSIRIPTMFRSDSSWVMMMSLAGTKSNNKFLHCTPIFSLKTASSEAKLEAASFYVLVSKNNSFTTNWNDLGENGRGWKSQLSDEGTTLNSEETEFLNDAIEMLDKMISAILKTANA